MTESDPELEAHVHGSDLRIERTLAAGIAEDLGLPTDALAPRLAAAAVVTGMRTVTEPVPRGEHERPASAEKTLALVDHTPRLRADAARRADPAARPEACWSTVRQPGPIAGFYQRIKARRGHSIAIVASARKLAWGLFFLLAAARDYASKQRAYERMVKDRQQKNGASATPGRASRGSSKEQVARQTQGPRLRFDSSSLAPRRTFPRHAVTHQRT